MFILIIHGIVFAEGTIPLCFVYFREKDVSLWSRGVDVGQTQAVGHRQSGFINGRTADDKNLFGIADGSREQEKKRRNAKMDDSALLRPSFL